MKRASVLAIALAVVAVSLGGCGGSPCDDYCQTFVDKTQKCGLGGPSGDNAAQACADNITISDKQCSDANTSVDALSCAEFKTIVCEQQGAAAVYNCGN
jgi:hypothetical protein